MTRRGHIISLNLALPTAVLHSLLPGRGLQLHPLAAGWLHENPTSNALQLAYLYVLLGLALQIYHKAGCE